MPKEKQKEKMSDKEVQKALDLDDPVKLLIDVDSVRGTIDIDVQGLTPSLSDAICQVIKRNPQLLEIFEDGLEQYHDETD